MKQLCIFAGVLLLLLSGSCRKIRQTQEQIAEDIVVKAMTDGRWTVTVYDDGTNHLPEFDGYEFQFKTNRTVDAIRNLATDATGTWEGDGFKRQISASFTPAAPPVLLRLNGLWQITQNNWTWVKATQTISGKLTTLELRKK
ncbi:MAG TPA: hypothetical protein PKE63_01570 [Lacibacter sp.]|nr:hypothetical protein [Lacibacter sp.]HMO87788.1 hypothetical protein [Lacibacter sp.]HMP85932.1 hypothetical protein [Lacibacter sp.]